MIDWKIIIKDYNGHAIKLKLETESRDLTLHDVALTCLIASVVPDSALKAQDHVELFKIAQKVSREVDLSFAEKEILKDRIFKVYASNRQIIGSAFELLS